MKVRKMLPLAIVMLGAIGLSGCDVSSSQPVYGHTMMYEIHSDTYLGLVGKLSSLSYEISGVPTVELELPERAGKPDFMIEGVCKCAMDGRIGLDDMKSHRAAEDCRYLTYLYGRIYLSFRNGPEATAHIQYGFCTPEYRLSLPSDRTEEGLLEWAEVSFSKDSNEEIIAVVKPAIIKQIEDTISSLEASS